MKVYDNFRKGNGQRVGLATTELEPNGREGDRTVTGDFQRCLPLGQWQGQSQGAGLRKKWESGRCGDKNLKKKQGNVSNFIKFFRKDKQKI